MFSGWRSHNSSITFDVGTAGARAFQATRRAGCLARRESMHLPLLPTQRDPNAQLPPPDYTRLTRLVGQGNFNGSDVALVLSPPEVRFCALRMPENALNQTPEKFREVLAWEVARETRMEAQAIEVRYWPLPPGHRQDLNVMAAALPIERAVAWHDLFARQNLHLRRIEASPCALAYLAECMWTPADDELWGILDLGFQSAALTVVLGKTPTYVRTLSTSSDRWTKRLAEAFEVSISGAEEIKRTHGIQMLERGVRSPTGKAETRGLMDSDNIPGVIFGLLREPLDELVHETSRCLSYVMQCFSEANATRLVLAGGGANLRGLADYLSLQLDMSVTPLSNQDARDDVGENPCEWVRPLCETVVSPESASSIGGALLDLETR